MNPLRHDLDEALRRRQLTGVAGGTASRRLASGDGWSVHDVVCTAGPEDRPYEERHSAVGIAIVLAGNFGYRSASGRELLTPGSLLLGNAGACFECGHEHGRGDRCLAFQFEPGCFERLAADAGSRPAERRFRRGRLPPARELAPLVARAAAAAAVADAHPAAWDELATELAARVVALHAGLAAPAPTPLPSRAERRVAEATRRIEEDPAADHSLATLAREAGLSPFHFLRSFERATGVTPHQFVLRARLRAASLRLAADRERVVDVAFDSGFGDLSNFNRTFRAELGATPTEYRRAARRLPQPSRSYLEAGGTTPLSRA